MLPARSKRYASADGEVPRLHLASNWQLMVIALIIGGLLVVIFPRKALIEELYDHERLDDLSLSYIDNLRRTDLGNADLAILLGRVRRDRMGMAEAEELLRPVLVGGDARQRAEARLLLVDAYQRQPAEGAGAVEVRRRLLEVLLGAARDVVPERQAGALAAAAFRVGRADLAVTFLQRLGGQDIDARLIEAARAALAAGRYDLAADDFLLARERARDRASARDLFRQGVGAWMAASRFSEAMRAADAHLGDLGDDAETLRFLVHSALAAGEPQRAAGYAQRLVFRAAGAGAPP